MTAEEEQDWAIGVIRSHPGEPRQIFQELNKHDKLHLITMYMVIERFRHIPEIAEELRTRGLPYAAASAALYAEEHEFADKEEEYWKSAKFMSDVFEWLWAWH